MMKEWCMNHERLEAGARTVGGSEVLHRRTCVVEEDLGSAVQYVSKGGGATLIARE